MMARRLVLHTLESVKSDFVDISADWNFIGLLNPRMGIPAKSTRLLLRWGLSSCGIALNHQPRKSPERTEGANWHHLEMS